MVRNSAHDSICACSVDDVVDAVLHRYAEARAIGEGLAARAVKGFARSLAHTGATILNPSQRARAGLVELVVRADGPAPAGVQVLSERSGLPGSMVLDADTVRTVLGMLQGPRISDDAWIHDVLIEDTDEGIDITIAVGTEEKPGVPIAEAKQDVYTRLGARPDAVVRVAMDQPSTRKILARTGEVPGYGWRAFEAAPLAHPVEVSESDGAVVLTNGLVRIDVDAATGTFALDGTPGYGRLVDGGDLGDSYNYSPPRQDSFVDTPLAVTVRVDERGPVRARVRITATYDWPDHVDGSSQARVGGHRVDVAHRRGGPGGRRHRAGRDRLRQPEWRPPAARPPPAPARGRPLRGRERVHRRHPGLDGRRPARRVRPPHRAGQPLRQCRDASRSSTRVSASTN